MAEMYVKLILKGKRYFEEVPPQMKEEVAALLEALDRADLIWA